MKKKKSSFSTQGQRADIGALEIRRMLPNRYADAVGPFVFFDHIVPGIRSENNQEGTGAHPHRGIATLSYILNGEDEHFDSAGNYALVHSGGLQWMNAGNGIIHDETLNYDTQTNSRLVHALQFWINLPSNIKSLQPEYLSVEGNKVPYKELPQGKGWVKVIAGSYEELTSVIPSYSEQFLYHVHLEAGGSLEMQFAKKLEVAVYLPELSGIINDQTFNAGEFIEFDREEGSIELQNELRVPCDFIVFGGEAYQEPIFAEGPFVMNSKLDIANAYRDYFNGDYGKIDYEKLRAKAMKKASQSFGSI